MAAVYPSPTSPGLGADVYMSMIAYPAAGRQARSRQPHYHDKRHRDTQCPVSVVGGTSKLSCQWPQSTAILCGSDYSPQLQMEN